jgi:hypothetical protein
MSVELSSRTGHAVALLCAAIAATGVVIAALLQNSATVSELKTEIRDRSAEVNRLRSRLDQLEKTSSATSTGTLPVVRASVVSPNPTQGVKPSRVRAMVADLPRVTTEESPRVGDSLRDLPLQTLHTSGFVAELTTCARSDAFVTCDVRFTNDAEDRKLGFWPTGKDPDVWMAMLRDETGRRYGPADLSAPDGSENFEAWGDGGGFLRLRHGATNTVRMSFSNVPQNVVTLREVYLSCSVYSIGLNSAGQKPAEVRFTKVAVVRQ